MEVNDVIFSFLRQQEKVVKCNELPFSLNITFIVMTHQDAVDMLLICFEPSEAYVSSVLGSFFFPQVANINSRRGEALSSY